MQQQASVQLVVVVVLTPNGSICTAEVVSNCIKASDVTGNLFFVVYFIVKFMKW